MNLKRLKLLGVRVIALMLIYSALRLAFWLAHNEVYASFSTEKIFASFLLGCRFDLAAIMWINTLFVLLNFTSVKENWERSIFIGLNGIFIIGAINDIELYLFNGKRMSMEFFRSLGMDLWAQIFQISIYYWYLPALGVFLVWGCWLLDKELFRRISEKECDKKTIVIFNIVLIALSFVAIRGGLQHKSIHVQSAFVLGANELGHLTLNTPYHFLRTFSTPQPQKKAWFAEQELQEKLSQRQQPPTYVGKPRHNVILLLLESVALEYVEQGYTPFLTELAEKGLFYQRHFANGKRSIEVLSAVLDGVPSVQGVPFSKSNAQGMPLQGVATKLKQAGYHTMFFHGAARGSMGFDAYALAHGIEKYYAREDYTGTSSDHDGHWGIFDGPYLQFALDEMNRTKKPFFAGVFTLSSHHPYTLPKGFQEKFPKGNLEIHESIGYVDEALRDFFMRAQTLPWYNETLFIITADHTQKLATKKYKNSLGQFRVPLILFHPGVVWDKELANKVTQHIDLPATILDFVDIAETGLNVVGESVLTRGPGKALHSLGGEWQFVQGDRVVRWVEKSEAQEFVWNFKTGEQTLQASTGLVNEGKLYVQYLLNGLRANRWPFTLP